MSAFFKNVDSSPEKKLIVIYQFGTRTFYFNRPYAGIKSHYQPRVFKCKSQDGATVIGEYEAIGDLLTANLPMMGTIEEEKLIGRESEVVLEDLLKVAYDANQVKKKINRLKQHGLLGGISD